MAHLEWTSDAGHVVWVRFDAVRTVEHRLGANVTRHPVEKGADISDHVRVELPAISVTGYVSKVPLFALAEISGIKDRPVAIGQYTTVELAKSPAQKSAISSALQSGPLQAGLDALSGLTSPNKVESLVLEDLGSRVKQMTDILTEIMEERRLVRFVDEARDYDDMVISSRIVTRTQRDFGAEVQLVLEQIKVVESKLTDLPVPLEPRGLLNKAKGAVAAKLGANENVDEKRRAKAKSDAAALFDGGLGGIASAVGGAIGL